MKQLIVTLKKMAPRRCLALPAAGLLTVMLASPLYAVTPKDGLSRSIDISKGNNRQEAAVQQKIDTLDDATRAMLDEYLRLNRELEALRPYNQQLQRMVASQVEERTSLQQQMDALEQTQHEVVPLMLKMVEWLGLLQQADMPFLPDERQRRVEQLNALMDRADVTLGEKYRRVLEAYQIEMDYSRTIEAYRGELKEGEGKRTVDFLRIGRVGLYYLTLDRDQAGYWNQQQGHWVSLSADYNLEIRNGLRIARQQGAPDLLRLPVAAPGELQP